MSKINLLPWREEMRKGHNRLFFFILGSMFFLSLVIIMLFNMYFSYRIGVENANIAYINNETKNIEGEVSEVKKLQEDKKQLIERMKVIQLLEIDRTSIVRLVDSIPHVLPENVYLTGLSRAEDAGEQTNEATFSELKSPVVRKEDEKNIIEPINLFQKKYSVSMEGVAVTNGSISVLLKNLEAITWISNVNLTEVSINKDGEGLNFKLAFTQNLTEKE